MKPKERHRDSHRRIRTAAVLVAAALMAFTAWGCAPRRANPELMATQADYARAQSDPVVRQAAAGQLHEADRILRSAADLWEQGGASSDVDNLASLARSQIQVAYSMAAYEKARMEIENKRAVEERARQLAATREESQAEEYPTVHSAETWRTPIDVRAHTAADGSVGGTLINNSPNSIAHVVMMVRYEWLWRNEFKPGADTPGRTEYVRITERIPPGESVRFTHSPTVPLPSRNDGRFETSVEVVAFDEIIQP